VKLTLSGSVIAMGVPTRVFTWLFSGSEKVSPVNVGASFSFVKWMVTVALPDRAGEPLSVTSTVRLKLGFVSRSSGAACATVICPVLSTSKAPPVFPCVISQVRVCVGKRSSSVAVTFPTPVPTPLFSITQKVAASTTGASLTSVRLMVT